MKDGVPSVGHLTAGEVLRLGTGCLACEFACTFHGNKAVIDVLFFPCAEAITIRGNAGWGGCFLCALGEGGEFRTGG